MNFYVVKIWQCGVNIPELVGNPFLTYQEGAEGHEINVFVDDGKVTRQHEVDVWNYYSEVPVDATGGVAPDAEQETLIVVIHIGLIMIDR
jgi:hypothetical protein